MRVVRRTSVLLAGALVASGIALLPAQADETSDPTTLAVEGTVRAVVVDRFGDEAASDHLFTVVTDAGAEIPVDLPEATPANGRFDGELVVDGDVEAALDAKDLLPREGSTIAEDTRAGRVAVSAAERQDAPLEVAEWTVAPVAAAAVTTPAAHRAYVAIMTNRGSVEESPAQVKALVDQMASYWTTESGGAIRSFDVQGDVATFQSSAAGATQQSCGMGSPNAVWNEARAQFPNVSFSTSSRNHLVVAMADECSDGGIAGVASVGNDLSSGGPMSVTLGDIATQVGVHEMGHTFGLGHANLDECPSTSTQCGDGVYFDLFSPMALAVSAPRGQTDPFIVPALDSAFRARLGVASTAEMPTMTTSGTITLAPRSDPTGVRGVQVVDPLTGVRYVVELRSGAGRDGGSFYASPYVLGGVPVRYDPGVTVTTISSNGTLTLLTRKATTPYDGAFAGGTTFTSPAGSTQIAVGPVSSAGTTVTVTLGAQAPPPAPVAPQKLAAATPRISGTAKVGRTLKVKVGSWAPRPTFRYEWFANGRKISSKSTKASFRLTSRQKGKRITVRVTGTKAGYATVSKTSRKTKEVLRS
ncbi:MAG: M12 family metallo-peptidase [Aeromicrobium sp.]